MGRRRAWRTSAHVLSVFIIALAYAPAASAQIVEYPNPNNPDRTPYERSLHSIAIAMLNIGCGDGSRPADAPVTIICQDRGTQFGRLLAIQLASYPVSAPTGGFSLTFDRTARAHVRTSSSFGPSFAERPLTNGRHRLSIGFTAQHTRFDAVDGIGLDSILGQAIVIRQTAPTGSFDTVSLELSADTAVVFASYGLTDRLDIGGTVPYKRIDFQGVSRSYGSDCGSFVGVMTPGPCIIVDFNPPLRRIAKGIGDVSLRAKYQWLRRDRLHLGTTLDVSFPTGRAEDFLGTGKVVTKATMLMSAVVGKISPHVNVGYTAGGNSLRSFQSNAVPGFTERSRELNIAAGVEVAFASRLTVTGDLLGRQLLDIGRLERTNVTSINSFGVIFEAAGDVITGKNLRVSLANVGFKLNVSKTYLVKADVLIPLNYNGLHSRWTPVFGLDYTF